ncbi:hypothetical protein LGH70_06375 [Hymenobacter sp. BT635]|uniref:Uncharacterized protein n=1 Tax=Hymenobacter nitidus TaxID=2880929 RepID=A0ABS8A9Z8_9BACT|nr:hypothetical protein [Hymenobacter nitidus]MCB2377200.1 hypothetical protein [Hymenobacter nitidus]
MVLFVVTPLENALLRELLPPYTANSPSWIIGSNLLGASLLSGFANWLYLKHAERKIARVVRKGLSEEETLRRLRHEGGTNQLFVISILAVVAVIITLARLYPEAFRQ